VRLRERVVKGLKTTFCQPLHAQVISLPEVLDLKHRHLQQSATGEKFLINPNK
jgi:hypothetical protein